MSNQEAPSNVDHKNSEVVRMLSNVALLDQKTTLSEQEIRIKKETPNDIRQLITIPKMNPMKINELLSMILSKLKGQNLLYLRAVCSHWKSVIEAMCAQKKCLMLHNFVDSNKLVSFSNRFFGKIKLEEFEKLKLKWTSVASYNYRLNLLTENFCSFLGQIFPNVDQLIVNLNLQDSNSTENLHNMIEKYWPNLNTLSLINRRNKLGTFRINKLKRFDVSGRLNVPLSREFIAQLEHFSCSYSFENSLHKMPELGPNCTSFYWDFYFGLDSTPASFYRYVQRNSTTVLSNITRLGLVWVKDTDGSLIRLICKNFPALQVLSVNYTTDRHFIFDSATCVQLSKLSYLTTLCFGFILIDLDSIESSEIQTRISSIRVLNIVNFKINGTNDPDFAQFDGFRFSRTLSLIFPNIERLGIFCHETVEKKIRDNLNHLGKSRKFISLPYNFYL